MIQIAYIVAVLAGVPASFVVGAAVFADGPSILSKDIGLAYQSLYVAMTVASACSGALTGSLIAAAIRPRDS